MAAIFIMARPRVAGARLCAPSTSRSASELPKAYRFALALQSFDCAAAGPADTAALRPCAAFIMKIAVPLLISVLNLLPAGRVIAQTFTTLHSFTAETP